MLKSWTDEMIEKDLRRISADLGVYPTATQLRELNRNDLLCAIGRSGGIIAWAERLGMDRQPSDSDTGWEGEEKLCGILRSRGWSAEHTGGVKHPFDIIVEGVLRVDAKSARYAEYRSVSGGKSAGWFYRIGKVPQADMVILVQLDRDDIFAIPWWDTPTSNLSIAPGVTIYEQYRNNFDLIGQFVEAYRKMREFIPPRKRAESSKVAGAA